MGSGGDSLSCNTLPMIFLCPSCFFVVKIPEKLQNWIAKGERCAILIFTPEKPGVSEKTALWKLNSAMKCAGPFR